MSYPRSFADVACASLRGGAGRRRCDVTASALVCLACSPRRAWPRGAVASRCGVGSSYCRLPPLASAPVDVELHGPLHLAACAPLARCVCRSRRSAADGPSGSKTRLARSSLFSALLPDPPSAAARADAAASSRRSAPLFVRARRPMASSSQASLRPQPPPTGRLGPTRLSWRTVAT